MTCNDCLHLEACQQIYKSAFNDNKTYIFLKSCELFKNKVDFVEVVRCKECNNCGCCYLVKRRGEKAIEAYYCKLDGRYVPPDHFCGCGKRRDT